MLLSVSDLVALVRSSVNVDSITIDEEGNTRTITDEGYLAMSDADIELFIKLGVSRAYPDVDDLEDLPDGSQFAVVLLAKIELYLKLAVVKANMIDMGADNNNYLKQSQRFDHYMKLVEEARTQYDDWLENESSSGNVVSTYDVLLSSRHYSGRNYQKQVTPKVRIKIDETTSDSVTFHWVMSNTSHFGFYVAYISTSSIVDMSNDGMRYSDKVLDGATLLKRTFNSRDTHITVKDLSPDTEYHIAVFSVERNQVFGYKETSFTTLKEESESN